MKQIITITNNKKMRSLIANSGIHFIETKLSFNPEDDFTLPSGRPLKYTFVETMDFLNNCRVTFDVCGFQSNCYVPVNYLCKNNLVQNDGNGTVRLDESGLPMLQPNLATTVMQSYPKGNPSLITINSLGSYRIKDPKNSLEDYSAFELLLGTWLPMPMFEMKGNNVSSNYPTGWCRVKIEKIGESDKSGNYRYRLLWAFDTKLSSNIKNVWLRPSFLDGDDESKNFALCNRVDNLLEFISIVDNTAISDYIVSKLGLDLDKISQHKYKYIGYYIYLVNFLRLSGAAPEIVLYNKIDKDIPVDLSLDIGNSRTCAVLFENGKFTEARPLSMRNLSYPWIKYDASFDMRIVFRKADFGNDLILDDDLFNWQSLLRVGEEAKQLVYRSLEDDGLAERTTNYSSPKRYLWDKKPYKAHWEFLVVEDDPTNLKVNPEIFIDNFTNYFDDDGSFLHQLKKISPEEFGNNTCNYSRSSLMTFVMIEILQQAIVDINSESFRNKHGNIDCRRYLRNIIITCPTAMPVKEQVTLRESALNAYKLLKTLNPTMPQMNVTPSPEMLNVTDDVECENRSWSYDEAFASQLVYLYAEIAQRYNGENDKVIEMKGHVRPEHLEENYNQKSLTIGSIDIGAGTTDIMICSYQYQGKGKSKLVPSPLFWDSFYLAGDDIMKNIIINQVIEGPVRNDPKMGCIYSALEYRLLRSTDEELKIHPITQRHQNYIQKIEDILRCQGIEKREEYIKKLASNMVHDYFGVNSSLKSHKDRRCRNDFNTQISIQISQLYLQLLAEKRPSRMYTFNEIFQKTRPAEYLLAHFAKHFGFRFEELTWRFDPIEVAEQVRAVLEPLMKQLSVVLNAYECDIVVLSGRPCSLDVITELFIKYYPISPDRLIRLGQYHVGNWYPLSDPQGYFIDQKSVVAVGAMVGYLACNNEFNGMNLDFGQVIKKMKSTANYIGIYESHNQRVEEVLLSPQKISTTFVRENFPLFLGCKQFNAPGYSARPLYAIYNNSTCRSLRITLQRSYIQNREEVEITDLDEKDGNGGVMLEDVEMVQQSFVDDDKHWLDKGEFKLSRR